MICSVYIEDKVTKEDGSLSDIQPSQEFRKKVIDALGMILEDYKPFQSINIRFVLPKNSNYLDVIFAISLVSQGSGKQEVVEVRFSSGNGWLPSSENMGFLTLERVKDKIKAAK